MRCHGTLNGFDDLVMFLPPGQRPFEFVYGELLGAWKGAESCNSRMTFGALLFNPLEVGFW